MNMSRMYLSLLGQAELPAIGGIAAAVLVACVGIWLVQRFLKSNNILGVAAGGMALVVAWGSVFAQEAPTVTNILLFAFGSIAVLGGVGFIGFRQPVHAALGFAASVLASASVFLLCGAPWIALATVLVYAGATIIVFLFVLMFAQRSSLQKYDLDLKSPWLAILVAGSLFALLANSLLDVTWQAPSTESVSGVAGFGQAMFGDYLWTVEIAGTLLLVATVGAIMIAQQGDQARSADGETKQQSQSHSNANPWGTAKKIEQETTVRNNS